MFVVSPINKSSLALDLSIAMLPTVMWAVYLFGVRAAVLMILCGLCCAVPDFCVQKFLFRRSTGESLSPFAFLAGVMTMLWFPVSVPLWFAMLAAVPVVLARSLYVYFGHRIFSPSVFAAGLMTVIFHEDMTRFTKPFAYFEPFSWSIDPRLIDAYRVKTPFDVLSGGTIYEDGALPQLYGFASGAMGTVAILCLLFGAGWLLYRRLLSIHVSATFLLTLFICAMAFAPDQVEITGYGFLYLLCGGVAMGAVFGLNDLSVLPRTVSGKLIIGVLAGIFTLLFRFYFGIDGVLYAILCCNLLVPLVEFVTKPADYYRLRKKDIVFVSGQKEAEHEQE